MSHSTYPADLFDRLERAIALNEDRDWAASPADAYLYAVTVGWGSHDENPLASLLELARRHGWTHDYVRQILEDRAAYRNAKARWRQGQTPLREADEILSTSLASMR